MTSAPLLDYAVVSDPFPLQASPATGDLVSCVLTVVASNPAPDPVKQPVTVEGIEITVPVGGDPSALTPDATGIDAVPPGGWTPQRGTPAGVYAFVPPGGSIAVGAEPLVFVLAAVQVNRVPGVVKGLTVQEGSGGCQPPDCPSTELDVVKFPNGWGKVEFDVSRPDIKAGAETSLSWSGPAGATYTLEWATPAGVVNVPAPGHPPLGPSGTYPGPNDPALTPAATTVFTLTVTESFDKVKYAAQVQKTVTVEPRGPSISLFTGELAYDANGNCKLTFHWNTDADYCQLGGGADELLPSSPPHGYNVDLVAPTGGFELVATRKLESGGVKTARATLTLGWDLTSQLAVAQSHGRTIPALSPDGARLYVAEGETLAAFEVPSDPATAPPALSSSSMGRSIYEFFDIAVLAGGDHDAIWAVVADSSDFLALLAAMCDAKGKITPPGGSFKPGPNGAGDFSRIAIAPSGAAYYTSPDGGTLYGDEVDASGTTNHHPTETTLDDSPVALALAADGTLYVGTLSGSIEVYATAANAPAKRTAQYSVSEWRIDGMALAAGLLWVASNLSVLVLDPANEMKPAFDPISLWVAADAIAVAPDGLRLYAASGRVDVLAPTALTGGVPG